VFFLYILKCKLLWKHHAHQISYAKLLVITVTYDIKASYEDGSYNLDSNQTTE